MSLIQEYRHTETAIEELKQRLEQLNSDERLHKELEFEKKLRALLGEHSKSLREVIAILDPNAGGKAKSNGAQATGQRRPRTLKRYKHPETGEVIETKGGNHKVLKTWKSEHGADTVEEWLQSE